MTETIAFIGNSLQGLYPEGEIRSFTRLIMEHVSGLQPHELLLHKDKEISEKQKQEISNIVERLKKHEPIQYILEETVFHDLSFKVNENVLIPRPETEELVELIIQENQDKKVSILDIGTGSGCIAISLAKRLTHAQVSAMDISSEALLVARENALQNQVKVKFIQTNILDKELSFHTIQEELDILVSNPPYIMVSEKEQMEKNVLEYEPHLALFVPDNDPLLFYRAIARFGKEKLKENGCLYFEINWQCGEELVALLKENGYKNVLLLKDLFGKDRFIKAIK